MGCVCVMCVYLILVRIWSWVTLVFLPSLVLVVSLLCCWCCYVCVSEYLSELCDYCMVNSSRVVLYVASGGCP